MKYQQRNDFRFQIRHLLGRDPAAYLQGLSVQVVRTDPRGCLEGVAPTDSNHDRAWVRTLRHPTRLPPPAVGVGFLAQGNKDRNC